MARPVNIKDLNLAVSRIKNIENRARQIAELKLEKEKSALISEFANHSVSKEISSGPSASNSSGTLGGYGNLFSFIGFSSGDDPVGSWINIIKSKIKIIKSETKYNNNIVFSFKVSNLDNELVSASMPWEGGISWIQAIERGISGFSFYVSKALGRSGGGIQSENKIRSGNYSPVSYWSKMWENFTKNLNK